MTPVKSVSLISIGAALGLMVLTCDSSFAAKQSSTNFKPRSNLGCLNHRLLDCRLKLSDRALRTRRSALRASNLPGPGDVDPPPGPDSGGEQSQGDGSSPGNTESNNGSTDTGSNTGGDQTGGAGDNDSSNSPPATDTSSDGSSDTHDDNGHGNDTGHVDSSNPGNSDGNQSSGSQG